MPRNSSRDQRSQHTAARRPPYFPCQCIRCCNARTLGRNARRHQCTLDVREASLNFLPQIVDSNGTRFDSCLQTACLQLERTEEAELQHAFCQSFSRLASARRRRSTIKPLAKGRTNRNLTRIRSRLSGCRLKKNARRIGGRTGCSVEIRRGSAHEGGMGRRWTHAARCSLPG